MNIDHLIIKGNFTFTGTCRTALDSIFFDNAGGSVSGVVVEGMSDNSGCQVGDGIVARATTSQTLSITASTVSGYDKDGVQASGPVAMTVSGKTTIGPPAALSGITAQNGLEYLNGASGMTSASTIYGSGDEAQAIGDEGTAVLLLGAKNVTLSNDVITGAGTDIGIDVTSTSTGIVISHNQIGRTAPDSPDPVGTGVSVETGSSATLICNTFSGWKTDIVGTVQGPCITTTTPPSGVVGHAYSTTLAACCGTAPYTFAVAAGTLPPGLTLQANGAITGTPTQAGTFNFTVHVVDSAGLASMQVMAITVDPAPTTRTTTPPAPVAPISTTSVPVTG
jgi:hypothetical protein